MPDCRIFRVVLSHGTLSVVVHSVIALFDEKEGLCFLTHLVKEELEDEKEIGALPVRPMETMENRIYESWVKILTF